MHSVLMISSLLLQLARGLWFIEPNYATAYKPVVAAILEGKQVDFSALLPQNPRQSKAPKVEKDEHVWVVNGQKGTFQLSYYNSMEDIPEGSVAITPVRGVVMKNNYCGSPGTKTLAAWMGDYDAHPNIIGHILFVDSPGGSADGTMDFSEFIKSLNKPVVAYCDGLMASAAYWIGSSAKYIMASNSLNEIGSIGTYMTITDWSGYDARLGIKDIEVYATKSTEKNIEFREALKGNVEPLRNRLIDPFNEAFLNSVKKNRFGKKLDEENTLKGQLHLTSDALRYGLIDGVGSFGDAVELVNKYANNA